MRFPPSNRSVGIGPIPTGVRSRFAAAAVPIRPRDPTSIAATTNTAAKMCIFFTFRVRRYNLTMNIATLCMDAYLKRTSRFSPQGHILRHRWTKTVPRLVLLDANALLMPFQFQVHLDAELRRVVGDVEVAGPPPPLAGRDHLSRRARSEPRPVKLRCKPQPHARHSPARSRPPR